MHKPYLTAPIARHRLAPALLALLTLLLTILAAVSPAQAGRVEMPQGKYLDSTVDLEVQALGGPVRVRRSWGDGGWHINRAWNDLALGYDSLTGEVERITRNGEVYTRNGGGALAVFTFGQRKYIATTVEGFQWRNRRGDWIDYHRDGKMQAYGDRNGIRVGVERDAQGQINTVLDHHGNALLRFAYDGDGHVTRVVDISDPAQSRSVSYGYLDGRLASATNPVGATDQFGYDGQGRLTTLTDANGHTTTLAYHPGGQVASLTRPGGRRTSYSYDYDNARKQYRNRSEDTGLDSAGNRVTLSTTEAEYNQAGILTHRERNGEDQGRTAVGRRDRDTTNPRGQTTRRHQDEWENTTEVIYPDGSTVTTRYDYRHHWPVETIDENGHITRYQYDDRSNLLLLTEAAGTVVERVTGYEYDALGQRITTRRPGDAITRYQYDSHGNLTQVTDPEGGITEYAYDGLGKLTRLTDPNGHSWTVTRDAIGRATAITSPLGGQIHYQWDPANNLIQATDPSGNHQTRSYDAENRLISVTDRLGNTTTIERDAFGNPTAILDPRGSRTTLSYDSNQRLTRTTDPVGNAIGIDYGYDTDPALAALPANDGTSAGPYPGLVNAIQYPTFIQTLDYDNRDRPIRTIDHLGDGQTRASLQSYDPVGNLTSSTDAEGRRTEYRYDALNRLTETIDPAGQSTLFGYDVRGNLVTVTDPNGHTTRYAYDQNDQQISETRPGGQQYHYDYDPAGNLSRVIDPDGRTTVYVYDVVNRIVEKQHYASASDADNGIGPERTIAYSYDGNSNLAGYTAGDLRASYGYDPLDRLTLEQTDYGPFVLGHGYQYDAAGNKTVYQDPTGKTFNYHWDPADRLQRIDLPDQGSIIAAEYDWNRISTLKYPGGSERHTTFDALQRATGIQATDPGGATLLNYRYDYDQTGNILGKRTEHGDYGYAYDNLQRLTIATSPLADEGWSYDPNGNRLSDNENPGAWRYDENDRLLESPFGTYQYDQAGNTIGKTETDSGEHWGYYYNAEGRLSAVDKDATTIATYRYDPQGRRYSKTVNGQTTYFHYTDEGMVGEYDGDGRLVQGYGFALDGTWSTNPIYSYTEQQPLTLYHNDHLGTPQQVTDALGEVLWSGQYRAFGETEINGPNVVESQLRFPGQYFDSCSIPCDYLPRRSYPLFQARKVLKALAAGSDGVSP